MARCKVAATALAAGLALTVLVGQALAQEAPRVKAQRTQAPRVRAPRAGGRQMGQWRDRYYKRIQDALESTDEAWHFIRPLIEKVSTLRRDAQARSFGFRRRMPLGGETRELTSVEKAVKELRAALENKEAEPGVIKAKLAALREARKRAPEELAKAQEKLRKVVTPRQEAQLVLFGILD